MTIWFPRLLAFATGFLSLSLEILWVRLASLTYRGAPQAFGLVLGLYLIGIALGAYAGKRACSRSQDLYRVSALVLALAAILDLLGPVVYAESLRLERQNALFVLGPIVVLVSALKSVVFPIAHHLGSVNSGAHVGKSVSRVYFFNILGATSGPLITGFLLLQTLTLQSCFELLACACTALALACSFMSARRSLRRSAALIGALVAVGAVAFFLPDRLVRTVLERTRDDSGTIGLILENRYGVIHTLERAGEPDTIYGGNAYDGRVHVRLAGSPNQIERVYLATALHPHPRRVLEIGLSVGSWAQVIVGSPGVEQLDIIEINPAYLELANRYRETRSLLTNGKVRIHIDDARRWLKRNPSQRYDVVVMNTTFHWRAYSGLLLSADFLTEVKRHMQPGALIAYNSTGSAHAYKTAATVFRHVYKYSHFVYASDSDLQAALHDALPAMQAVTIDSYSPRSDELEQISSLKSAIESGFTSYEAAYVAPYRKENRPLEIITDQNLITEYRYGQSFHGFLRWPR